MTDQQALVNPDGEEVEINEHGGANSKRNTSFLRLPIAFRKIAEVCRRGEYYDRLTQKERNFMSVSCEEHLEHAVAHIYAFTEFPNVKDLAHAGCRVLMALEVFITGLNHEEEF